MKKLKFPILILALLLMFSYISFRKKKDRPAAGANNPQWTKKVQEIGKGEMTQLNIHENIIFDQFDKDFFYSYPAVPNTDEYIFNEIVEVSSEGELISQKIDHMKEVPTPKEFSGYPAQNITTYNRVDLGDAILLNTHNKLYLIDKNKLSYDVIKTFDMGQDYTRRFKYLYMKDKILYYMYNHRGADMDFELTTNEDNPDSSILYKENLSSGQIDKIDLRDLNLVEYSDYIHLENRAIDNYLLNTVGDNLYFYDVIADENKKIMNAKDYYFQPAQSLDSKDFYIERSIFGNHGVGIFKKPGGELVNVLTDSSKYGSIHDMKLYNDRYLLLEPAFNPNANMESFKIVDLDQQINYYYDIKDSVKDLTGDSKFLYRVFDIQDGYAYIQTISQGKEKEFNLLKLKLNLDIN